MKTRLKKKEKVTQIHFNAADTTAGIYTHDTALKKRLRAYATSWFARENNTIM